MQPLVELRVGGPPQEGLPELRLTFALRPAAQRTHAALLARPEQVAQGRSLAAAFTVGQKERAEGFSPSEPTRLRVVLFLLL